ncbi:MAG TPA: hypothetical protein VKT83_16590 [bacterium]|nr:hypothetical protein [bacterium]
MRGILNAGRVMMILMLALPAGALAQPAAPQATPSIFLVVPGLGVGQWTVDGKVADYVWVMGDSQITETRPSGTDLVFRPQLEERSWSSTPRIFIVYLPTSSIVWAVGTDDPHTRTIDRVGVGSTQDQVTAAYQDPQAVLELPLRSRTMIYDSRGIAFESEYLPAAGQFSAKIGRVFVFRPGQARAIWRLQ